MTREDNRANERKNVKGATKQRERDDERINSKGEENLNRGENFHHSKPALLIIFPSPFP